MYTFVLTPATNSTNDAVVVGVGVVGVGVVVVVVVVCYFLLFSIVHIEHVIGTLFLTVIMLEAQFC